MNGNRCITSRPCTVCTVQWLLDLTDPHLVYLGFNPLNAELNRTSHLLALLGAHHIFHVSGLRFN